MLEMLILYELNCLVILGSMMCVSLSTVLVEKN